MGCGVEVVVQMRHEHALFVQTRARLQVKNGPVPVHWSLGWIDQPEPPRLCLSEQVPGIPSEINQPRAEEKEKRLSPASLPSIASALDALDADHHELEYFFHPGDGQMCQHLFHQPHHLTWVKARWETVW